MCFEVGVLVEEFVDGAVVEEGEKFDLSACGIAADSVVDVVDAFLPVGVCKDDDV